MAKKRIEYLDIAKGIGIMLVVWSHANGPFSSQINQFHMPFFFILSGLLYNRTSSLNEFTIKRIKRLYIPFVFWNIPAIWLEGFLFNSNIISVVKNTVTILLTLSKSGTFFGATWFLGALFLVSVSYRIADELMPSDKIHALAMLLLFSLFAFLGFSITMPYMFSRTLILGFFFAVGVFANNHIHELARYTNIFTTITSATVFCVISQINSVKMSSNEYRFPLLFVFGASLATCVILYLCKSLTRLTSHISFVIRECLSFFGRRSMDIVIWHFVSFRICIILQMYLNKEPITIHNILKYYPTYDTTHGWHLLYFIVGVTVPLLWCDFLRFSMCGKLLRKIHVI